MFDTLTAWNTDVHGFLKEDARTHPGLGAAGVAVGCLPQNFRYCGAVGSARASAGAGTSHRSSSELRKEFYLKMLRWGLSFGFQELLGLAELFVMRPRSAGGGPGSSSCLIDPSVSHVVLKEMNLLMKRNCGSETEMIPLFLFSWEGALQKCWKTPWQFQGLWGRSAGAPGETPAEMEEKK